MFRCLISVSVSFLVVVVVVVVVVVRPKNVVVDKAIDHVQIDAVEDQKQRQYHEETF